ncbi:MAG: molybdopterin-dependent oxidoreductase [Acidimicrobiia bacterium]|nr:molybdopterin-dependent oxidoreductase [Acidimicrobiia bacterium]
MSLTRARRGLGRLLGVDHGGDRYAFVDQAGRGPVSASRAADHWARTTCGYCSVGCGMLVGVRDGRAVAVEGDPDHPVNRGRLCPKGLCEHQMIHAEGRLTQPLVCGRPTTWGDALGHVTDGFKELLERHGPESVAVLSTGQLVTEEFYALGKLVRLGMGLRHYDGNTTLCMASAASGYKLSFGTDGPPGCYDDLALADVVVLWGANVADNHPLLAPRVLGNEGQTLVVVDPRVTKTAMLADVHLPVRPRGDIALLNGILVVLLEEGLVDLESRRAHVEGIDELLAHLAGWTVGRAAAESGIDVEALRSVARAIGRAERCVLAWTMGVNHSVQGTETVTLLNSLALLTGNIGRPGAAPFSITGQCNAMGTRESGFTASMPGYRGYDNPAHRAELAALWGIDEARLPTDRGRAYPDIVNAVMSRKIKGLWVIATNPLVSFPNRGTLELALRNLDVLVVQDGFETPTTAIADVVLPAAVWGEKEGTFTNSERRVSRVRAAVAPPGEARSDFDIFLALARRWGCAEELFPGWAGPEDAFAEWRRVSAGRPCDYSGITWERIDAAGGVQWPCAEGAEVPLGGTPRLYTDLVFNRPGGRAAVHPVEPRPLRDAPRPEFPLLLNTGRTVEHWHTRTKTGRIPILERLAPEAWVEVNPADAAALHVKAGDWVRVSSARGEVERIRVRVTAIVRRGEVFIPFHWDERCANRLTDDEFDPISREPNYEQCAVRVERVDAL